MEKEGEGAEKIGVTVPVARVLLLVVVLPVVAVLLRVVLAVRGPAESLLRRDREVLAVVPKVQDRVLPRPVSAVPVVDEAVSTG